MLTCLDKPAREDRSFDSLEWVDGWDGMDKSNSLMLKNNLSSGSTRERKKNLFSGHTGCLLLSQKKRVFWSSDKIKSQPSCRILNGVYFNCIDMTIWGRRGILVVKAFAHRPEGPPPPPPVLKPISVVPRRDVAEILLSGVKPHSLLFSGTIV